jgi:hypothetical protein
VLLLLAISLFIIHDIVQITLESFLNLLEHVSRLGHTYPVRLLADFSQVAQIGLHCLDVIYTYPGGVYHTKQTVFNRLEDENIDVPEEDRYYPNRATYDIEVMLQPTDKRPFISVQHPNMFP